MDEDIKKVDQVSTDAAAMALPLRCPRDSELLYEGVKTIVAGGNTYNFDAWLCPSCNHWQIRTVTS